MARRALRVSRWRCSLSNLRWKKGRLFCEDAQGDFLMVERIGGDEDVFKAELGFY